MRWQHLKARYLPFNPWYDHQIMLNPEARSKLLWWLHHMDAWNSRTIIGAQLYFILESNTSMLGWGATSLDAATGDRWTVNESDLHINCLQLIASSFAIRSFANDKIHCCILLRKDNSAVWCINRLGGARSCLLSNQRYLPILFRHRNLPGDRISSWLLQFYGRLVLQVLAGLQRLTTGSGDLLHPSPTSWSIP